MAPKAAAKAKAKRKYRARVSVPAPAPIRAHNEQRQAAFRARPGRLYRCPQCSYPRYVPTETTGYSYYRCAMPRVRVPGGERLTCDFITSASSWRHEHPETPEKEEAFKAVVEGAVLAMEAALQADTLPPQGYWPTMKRELADRIAAQEPPPQPAQPPAAAPDALAQVPAAE
mgnify:FL=1